MCSSDLAFVLPRAGSHLRMELAPLPDRADLLPLSVTVAVDGTTLGQVTLAGIDVEVVFGAKISNFVLLFWIALVLGVVLLLGGLRLAYGALRLQEPAPAHDGRPTVSV